MGALCGIMYSALALLRKKNLEHERTHKFWTLKDKRQKNTKDPRHGNVLATVTSRLVVDTDGYRSPLGRVGCGQSSAIVAVN